MRFSSAYTRPMSGLASIFLDEMVDVAAVRLGEPCAIDEQNILGIEFGAAGKIVGTCDHGVVDYEHLVMHEIVSACRSVRR